MVSHPELLHGIDIAMELIVKLGIVKDETFSSTKFWINV